MAAYSPDREGDRHEWIITILCRICGGQGGHEGVSTEQGALSPHRWVACSRGRRCLELLILI